MLGTMKTTTESSTRALLPILQPRRPSFLFAKARKRTMTTPAMRKALYGSRVPAANPKKQAERKGKAIAPRTV